MFCYIYKDMDRYEQCADIMLISKVSSKEQFKCFEVTHKPTSIRMVYFIGAEITFGEWRT